MVIMNEIHVIDHAYMYKTISSMITIIIQHVNILKQIQCHALYYDLGGIGGGVSSIGEFCAITSAIGAALFSSTSMGNLPNSTKYEVSYTHHQ